MEYDFAISSYITSTLVAELLVQACFFLIGVRHPWGGPPSRFPSHFVCDGRMPPLTGGPWEAEYVTYKEEAHLLTYDLIKALY